MLRFFKVSPLISSSYTIKTHSNSSFRKCVTSTVNCLNPTQHRRKSQHQEQVLVPRTFQMKFLTSINLVKIIQWLGFARASPLISSSCTSNTHSNSSVRKCIMSTVNYLNPTQHQEQDFAPRTFQVKCIKLGNSWDSPELLHYLAILHDASSIQIHQ